MSRNKSKGSASELQYIALPEEGEEWECITASYRGWLVKILKVNGLTVKFEQVKGPARSRGKRDSWPRHKFMACYRRHHATAA